MVKCHTSLGRSFLVLSGRLSINMGFVEYAFFLREIPEEQLVCCCQASAWKVLSHPQGSWKVLSHPRAPSAPYFESLLNLCFSSEVFLGLCIARLSFHSASLQLSTCFLYGAHWHQHFLPILLPFLSYETVSSSMETRTFLCIMYSYIPSA